MSPLQSLKSIASDSELEEIKVFPAKVPDTKTESSEESHQQ